MNTPVYILHGWAYDLTKWDPFMKQLKAAGIEAILLRVPGLTTEPLDKPWTIEDYISWLDKEIGSGPVQLVGHSNGGRIILNYALKYPDKVLKIVLIDSAGLPRTELKARVKKIVFKSMAKTGKMITSSPKAQRLLYKLARVRDYEEANPLMRQTMSNLLNSDKSLMPSRITVPTHLVWGRDDTATPLKDAYKFQRLIKGADLDIVEGARHSPQFTHTDETLKHVIKALRRGDI